MIRHTTSGQDADGEDTTTEDSTSNTDGNAAVRDDPSPDGHPTCPFCESISTEQESQFGSEISTVQYYCNDCRTVFEHIRYDGKRPDTIR